VVRPTPVPPLAYNVADRRRLPPPRRPLPLLDTDLDLDLECVLPLLLEVLCLDLLSSRRSRALCKPLLPGRSSHLCLRRSPRETLRLCSALHVDVVDKSAQNLPTTLAQSPSCAHCSMLVPTPSPLVQGLSYLLIPPFSGHGPVQLESVHAPLPHL
jgi:hypothetical protein